ncbi:hypothetical protein DL96DRAFT_1607875 [Flagelloscypha sp. PMI_526]|nr:hypothetical protein DL96DRAFT_1607875 [Flagelloscypha sp. PMI_526]
MPMNTLADELVWEIITLVASDNLSLKSFTLVNRRLGSLGRKKLYAQYPICIRPRSPSVMGGLSSVKGKTPADFIALLEASPELADLICRVKLSKEHLISYEAGLPASLEKLVNIQSFEILWLPRNPVDWTAIPRPMQNSLLNVVFPRLANLFITMGISNIPSNILDYTPLLSHLDLRSPVELVSNTVTDGNPDLGEKQPAPPILRLLEGKIDENLHLVLKGVNSHSMQLLHQGLGLYVRHLTVGWFSGMCSFPLLETTNETVDILLPFTSLPCLRIFGVVFAGWQFHVNDRIRLPSEHPIPCLNRSLLGQKDLTISNVIFNFGSFPVRFNASEIMKAAYAECDELLGESCPELKSVHAIFNVDRRGTSEQPFCLEDVRQELEELLPRSSEKGILSVEDITPDISPWT